MSPFISAALFIFVALQFSLPEKTWRFLRVLAPFVSWGLVGYSVYSAHGAPLEALPVISLFLVWVAETLERKNLESLITYAPALLASAFFTKDPMTAVVFIMASDALLAADLFGSLDGENRSAAAKSLSAAMVSMLPAMAVILLKCDAEITRAGIFLTIALRILYWPLTHWSLALPRTKGRNYFVVCSGGIACFALWKVLGEVSSMWSLIILVTAGVSAIGGRGWSAAIFSGLAVFSLKESWVHFVPAMWPLLWRGGRNRILLILLTAVFMAVSAPMAFSALVEPWNVVFAVVVGILCGRAFGAYLVKQAHIWWELMTVAMGLLLLGLPFILSSEINLSFPEDTSSLALAAALVLTGALGWVFQERLKRVFHPVPSVDFFQKLGALVDRIAIRERGGSRGKFEMKDTSRLNAFIDALDADFALIAISFGGFAAWLIWSLQ